MSSCYCGLTACTPGSAPGQTLGIEYGKAFTCTFHYYLNVVYIYGCHPGRALQSVVYVSDA